MKAIICDGCDRLAEHMLSFGPPDRRRFVCNEHYTILPEPDAKNQWLRAYTIDDAETIFRIHIKEMSGETIGNS